MNKRPLAMSSLTFSLSMDKLPFFLSALVLFIFAPDVNTLPLSFNILAFRFIPKWL